MLALERLRQPINQLTAGRLIKPQIERPFRFEKVIETHRYVERGVLTL